MRVSCKNRTKLFVQLFDIGLPRRGCSCTAARAVTRLQEDNNQHLSLLVMLAPGALTELRRMHTHNNDRTQTHMHSEKLQCLVIFFPPLTHAARSTSADKGGQVAFQLHTQEVPGSNHSPETSYPEGFCGLPVSPQANAEAVAQIRP
jgi:hypothetical protein